MNAHKVLDNRPSMVAKAAKGRGVGINEAVAAAEARVDVMRDVAEQRIGATVARLQELRPALDEGEPQALKLLRAEVDALVGLCGMFKLAELGQAAFSLCQLIDAAAPAPPGRAAVRVHLDALQLFAGASPAARQAAAPQVLAGLRSLVAPRGAQPAAPAGA